MKILVAGLFTDSQAAGEAVADLYQANFTEDVSVIAKDELKGKLSAHQVKEDVSEGAATGVAAGTVVGALGGLLAAATPVTIAGVGVLLLGGPLAALLGAATGAVAGGLLGAFTDAGFPEERARMFEHRIQAGDVLVAVTIDPEQETVVKSILTLHGAEEVGSLHLH
ncbi:MAG TPA: hypothetical protein VF209_01445 [Patescibacteria group bacterium]